jgi:hypothetical protein
MDGERSGLLSCMYLTLLIAASGSPRCSRTALAMSRRDTLPNCIASLLTSRSSSELCCSRAAAMRDGVRFREPGVEIEGDAGDLIGVSSVYRAFSRERGAGEVGDRSGRPVGALESSSCLRLIAVSTAAGLPRAAPAASGRRPRLEEGIAPETTSGREGAPLEKYLDEKGGAGEDDAGTRTGDSGEGDAEEGNERGDCLETWLSFLLRRAARDSLEVG